MRILVLGGSLRQHGSHPDVGGIHLYDERFFRVGLNGDGSPGELLFKGPEDVLGSFRPDEPALWVGEGSERRRQGAGSSNEAAV